VLRRLQLLADGSPAERLALAAGGRKPRTRAELQRESGLDSDALEPALADALQQGLLVALDGPRWLVRTDWRALERRLSALLTAWHQQYPLRRGMPREALRSQLGVEQGTLAALVTRNGAAEASGDIVRLREHEIQFSPEQQRRVDKLLQLLDDSPFTPPSWTEAAAMTGEELLAALLERRTIVRVAPELLFGADAWREMVRAVLEFIERDGSVSARQLRDRFGTSRKYAIGLLEALDEARITRREGDVRVRGPASLPAGLREAGPPAPPQRPH